MEATHMEPSKVEHNKYINNDCCCVKGVKSNYGDWKHVKDLFLLTSLYYFIFVVLILKIAED